MTMYAGLHLSLGRCPMSSIPMFEHFLSMNGIYERNIQADLFILVELVEEIIRTEMKVGKGAPYVRRVDRQQDALCSTICFV